MTVPTPCEVYVGPIVYRGACEPEALRITVRSEVVDLRDVASVAFVVEDVLGSRVTWAASITPGSVFADRLEAVHVFDAQGRETERRGRFLVWPRLTLAGGGVRRVRPVTLTVV
jgi:hypothetical protein